MSIGACSYIDVEGSVWRKFMVARSGPESIKGWVLDELLTIGRIAEQEPTIIDTTAIMPNLNIAVQGQPSVLQQTIRALHQGLVAQKDIFLADGAGFEGFNNLQKFGSQVEDAILNGMFS